MTARQKERAIDDDRMDSVTIRSGKYRVIRLEFVDTVPKRRLT